MKIKFLPVITRIISKLNISDFIKKLKEIDFEEESSLTNLSQEDLGKVGFLFLEVILTNINYVEEDIEMLIALYENKKKEEIQELDIVEEFTKIFEDEGIRKAFSFALKK